MAVINRKKSPIQPGQNRSLPYQEDKKQLSNELAGALPRLNDEEEKKAAANQIISQTKQNQAGSQYLATIAGASLVALQKVKESSFEEILFANISSLCQTISFFKNCLNLLQKLEDTGNTFNTLTYFITIIGLCLKLLNHLYKITTSIIKNNVEEASNEDANRELIMSSLLIFSMGLSIHYSGIANLVVIGTIFYTFYNKLTELCAVAEEYDETSEEFQELMNDPNADPHLIHKKLIALTILEKDKETKYYETMLEAINLIGFTLFSIPIVQVSTLGLALSICAKVASYYYTEYYLPSLIEERDNYINELEFQYNLSNACDESQRVRELEEKIDNMYQAQKDLSEDGIHTLIRQSSVFKTVPKIDNAARDLLQTRTQTIPTPC